MTQAPHIFASARMQLDQLALGQVSAADLLEEHIARSGVVNPAINAVVRTDLEGARTRAAELDRLLKAGIPAGPLHGLPITIKDTFDVEGMPATSGAPEYANRPAKTADAAAVARLRAAGAVIWGKTNTPYLAGDNQTYNPVHGRTSNPWDLSRTPGGSSGGAAAALATGVTSLELGSDIGGSLRLPAHFCGVAALKPTYGRTPIIGHVPPAPGSLAVRDLNVAGPMARDVADLRLMFQVLTDQPVTPLPRKSSLKARRIGIWAEDKAFPVSGECTSAVEVAAEAAAEAGAQVLVAIMHDGGVNSEGAANDPSYVCVGLQGRGVDIAKRLDPAYAIIISGHTHQAYTCKINGRLFVQAGSYGGWLTESRLTLDATGQVLDAQAINHPVLQAVNTPNPAFVALVQRAAALTAAIREKPVAVLSKGAQRSVKAPFGDSPVGNLVADAQLAYGKKRGTADIAMTNSGGIRADLAVEPGRAVTLSDLFAIQPFGNELVAVTITGAQLQELVRRLLPKRPGAASLQISHNVNYQWSQAEGAMPVLDSLTVDGKPVDPQRDYRVVASTYLADGGDSFSALRLGRDRQVLGMDIDALVDWLAENPKAVDQINPGRIQRN